MNNMILKTAFFFCLCSVSIRDIKSNYCVLKSMCIVMTSFGYAVNFICFILLLIFRKCGRPTLRQPLWFPTPLVFTSCILSLWAWARPAPCFLPREYGKSEGILQIIKIPNHLIFKFFIFTFCLYWNIHKIKFTILTIFKCTVQYC